MNRYKVGERECSVVGVWERQREREREGERRSVSDTERDWDWERDKERGFKRREKDLYFFSSKS